MGLCTHVWQFQGCWNLEHNKEVHVGSKLRKVSVDEKQLCFVPALLGCIAKSSISCKYLIAGQWYLRLIGFCKCAWTATKEVIGHNKFLLSGSVGIGLSPLSFEISRPMEVWNT